MPSSDPSTVGWFAYWLTTLQPKKILDVGIGFGRYGFMIREFLEVWNNRYHKKDWTIRIDGIEIFEDYITPIHEYLYDNIHITDIRQFCKNCEKYDLIILGDVIEHMPRNDGFKIIDILKKKCRWMIIQTPLGFMLQPPVFDNMYEEHVSSYNVSDFPVYRDMVMNDRIFAVLVKGDID